MKVAFQLKLKIIIGSTKNDILELYLVKMNNDLLEILINKVEKPTLWLYWVYNDRIYHDEFKYSEVIKSNTYEDVCAYIFENCILHFIKYGQIQLPLYYIEQIRRDILNNSKGEFDKECTRCHHFYCENSHRFCINHYPLNEVKKALKDMNKDEKVNVVEKFCKDRKIKIKKLNYD